MLNNDCQACKLQFSRKNCVVGEGNPNADIMFVGGIPSSGDDLTNRIFNPTDGTGRIFNGFLYRAGLKRDDVYITYAVQCRPPNNRAPEADEIIACSKRLSQTIQSVKPKILIALGDISAAILTGKDKGWRGNIVFAHAPFNNTHTLITWAPDQMYKDPTGSMFAVVQWDYGKAIRHLRDPYPLTFNPEYFVNPHTTMLRTILEGWRLNEVTCDIETSSETRTLEDNVDPYKNWLIGIAFCGEPNKAVSITGQALKVEWPYIKQYLETHAKLVWQNNLFDRTTLRVKEVDKVSNYYDTMDAMHCIMSSQPKSLDFMRSLYTNFPPYKKKYKDKGSGDLGNLSEKDLGWYNCGDVDMTYQIMQGQKVWVDPKLLNRFLRNDNNAMQMRLKGVKVGRNVLAYHYSELIPTISRLQKEFYEKYKVDIGSPKQLSGLLYNQLGFKAPPFARGKTFDSTKDQVIEYLLKGCIGNPVGKKTLQEIQEFRSTRVVASTFCEGVFKKLDENDILHPEWMPTGTDTSRWSCKQPNLMNQPKFMRDQYIPRDGHIFFGSDYNKVEFISAGILADEYELVDLLCSGEPTYELIDNNILDKEGNPVYEINLQAKRYKYYYKGAYDLWGNLLKEVEKKYPLTESVGATQAKLRIKAIVYGTIFGRQAKSIAREFGVNVQVVEKWVDGIFGPYPKLRKYFDKYIPDFYEENQYVQTFHGFKKYARTLPQAANEPVQGTAAEVQYDGLDSLIRNKYEVVISVHDQTIAEEPVDESTQLARFKKFCELLEHAAPDVHHTFPVEAATGYNWKEVD